MTPPGGGSQLCLGSGRTIGAGLPTFVVAEIGQNHNGCVTTAEQLIDAAAWAGADAVKVVKRDLASELTAAAGRRPYRSPNAFGATYGEHRAALELSADGHTTLARRVRRLGLMYFGTACDVPSARLLQRLEVDAFKVASRDLDNHPLLADLAARGRPLVLSTGMSTLDEIDAAVEIVCGQMQDLALLHSTSLYPTPDADVHLRSLPTLAARYALPVGFSDHSLGTLMTPLAVALGATLIEKHLTLDRAAKGTDHVCSLEPEEFRQMVADIRRVEAALGRDDKPLAADVAPTKTRLGRQLVTRTALRAGQSLTAPDLTLKCAGVGLSWLELPLVVGRRLRRDLAADEPLTVADLS